MKFRHTTQNLHAVRYSPHHRAIAIRAWILDKAVQIRHGNPYLEEVEAVVVAVREFRRHFPHLRGGLRGSDGRFITGAEAVKAEAIGG